MLIARTDISHKQNTSSKGWVGHDMAAVYANVLKTAKDVLDKAGIDPGQIGAVGLSNQRETAVCWHRKSGEPLYEAVVWQCGRARQLVERMERENFSGMVRERTGLYLSPYFSAAKFAWMIENVDSVKHALAEGDLCCGTVDSWLVFKLTGGSSFKTDYSNASRTMLVNLDTMDWDEQLISVFGLRRECLPEICHSDSNFGMTTFQGLFPKPVPIHGVLGDSSAALFANRCISPFTAKATYGTGSSVMMNAGLARPVPKEGIVASLAWGINGEIPYVLEGNINYTGAVIKWLLEDIELIQSLDEAKELAQKVPDTNGVYLIPAFSGMGAPYFIETARAALTGMNRITKKAHIVRAAEECIAYQIKDVVERINLSVPQAFKSLKTDGGPTRDSFLMQFQSDILRIPIEISKIEELSGAGAAYCAAIGSGFSDEGRIFSGYTTKKIEPLMDEKKAAELYSGWIHAVEWVAAKK